jgi:hypothetical protein
MSVLDAIAKKLENNLKHKADEDEPAGVEVRAVCSMIVAMVMASSTLKNFRYEV